MGCDAGTSIFPWAHPPASPARASAPAQASTVGRVTAAHIIRRPVRRLALASALCTCLLAGCGGGDDGEKSGRTQTVAAGKAVHVVAREYSFDPANVVIRGGGGPVKITLANKGSLAHNLKVEQGDRELGGTPTFQSGRSKSGTVSLDPGSYTMICTVGNHAELGMRGKLEVER